jgi:5'-AMP-activated protein kinase catalytic alpha subunit
LQQEHHVTEKKEEEQPTAMNAFELISMSKGLNLGNLFDGEQVCLLKGLSFMS